jgi:hypothetical protein
MVLAALAKRGNVVHLSSKARKMNHKLLYILNGERFRDFGTIQIYEILKIS